MSARMRILSDTLLLLGVVTLVPAGAYAIAAGALHLSGAAQDETATVQVDDDDNSAVPVSTQ